MLSPMQIQRMCTNYYVADYEVRFLYSSREYHFLIKPLAESYLS